MKKPAKLSKENIALALFMECVPKLIELWKNKAPELTFDEFCLNQYNFAKLEKDKKKKIK